MSPTDINANDINVSRLIALVIAEAANSSAEIENHRCSLLLNPKGFQGEPANCIQVRPLTSQVRCEIKSSYRDQTPGKRTNHFPRGELAFEVMCDPKSIKSIDLNYGCGFGPGADEKEYLDWAIKARLVLNDKCIYPDTGWQEISLNSALERLCDFAFGPASYEVEDDHAKSVVARFLVGLSLVSKGIGPNHAFNCDSAIKLSDGSAHIDYTKFPCGILAQVAIAGKIFYETPGEDFEYSPL